VIAINILRDEKGRFVKDCYSTFKGKHHTEEIKRKLSEIQNGQHHSPSTEFKKGFKPWNKGIKWWTEEYRKNQIETRKGTHSSPKTEFKKDDPKLIGNKINLGRKHTEEWKIKNGEMLKLRWKNEEFREKNIKAALNGLLKRPTSLEKKFIEIVRKHDLPYEYVGNGSFLIGFKNPDFINLNGQKICIEVANHFHHQGDWTYKRIEHFKKWGWDCIVIFEEELKDENKILDKINNL